MPARDMAGDRGQGGAKKVALSASRGAGFRQRQNCEPDLRGNGGNGGVFGVNNFFSTPKKASANKKVKGF